MRLLPFSLGSAVLLAALSAPLPAQIGPVERALRSWIAAHHPDQIALLQRMVDQPSGSLNPTGVRALGALYQSELDALGFTTRWVELPAALRRAGHLVAERRGPARPPGGLRVLLLGHFDTVFEGPTQRFVRQDSIARGAGTADMKGGDVVLLSVVKALAAAGGGVLDRMDVRVVITGDEESVGRPVTISRQAMIEAAQQSDLALSFEGGGLGNATIGRRGASGWILRTSGRQAHSSGVFGAAAGYGALFELARILNGFREALAGWPGLTFNPGLAGGGETVVVDTSGFQYAVSGKTNIVAPTAIARGDLRFTTDSQRDSARAVMRDIVAGSLAGTDAEISFEDTYPAMPVTRAGLALLAQYDSASRALGYPPVVALDPQRRGAGDISFVAPLIPGLDGLGPFGGGAHSPEEWVNLPSLRIQTERAAVLLLRLATRRP